MVGAVLTIAMTLIAGAATWGFVRSQAGVSENALQSNAANTNNLLNEHFGVVDMYFGTTTSTTFWCPWPLVTLPCAVTTTACCASAMRCYDTGCGTPTTSGHSSRER